MLTLSTLRVDTLLQFQAVSKKKPYLEAVMISTEGTKKVNKIIKKDNKRNQKEPKGTKRNQKEPIGTKRNQQKSKRTKKSQNEPKGTKRN